MQSLQKKSALLTDLYQLTMMQSYFEDNRLNDTVSFDYFFRKLPFDGGFVVFAGLNEILSTIEQLKFTNDELTYLKQIGYNKWFLNYLKHFSFRGNILSMQEGSIIFPNEPVLSISGNLIECQLIETILLNTLNFNSLIATKAARIRITAGNKVLSDFGLRRSQGIGGIQASQASIIGGFDSTSNVLAAKEFGLKAVGTMAHSYIQSYNDELTAFRKFAESNPNNCTLLIDTYNTLKIGLPNAIKVAKELEQRGEKLIGVRLDSGDLIFLSKEVRKELDSAGLSYVKIVASNQLDEYAIDKIIKADAPIDIFGVGTNLVIGKPDAALDGVYKLSSINNKPSLKLSENEDKTTLPGSKQVYRIIDENGFYNEDIIALENDSIDEVITDETKHVKMLNPVMANGKIINESISVEDIKKKVLYNLDSLKPEQKRIENPEQYKITLSNNLKKLQSELRQKHINNTK